MDIYFDIISHACSSVDDNSSLQGPERNIWTMIAWIAMKVVAQIHVPQMMTPADFFL